MKIILKSVAFLAALALAVPAIAQDTAGAENTAEQTTDTTEANLAPLDLGQIYQRETHGDWVIECISTATPINDPCEMNQLLSDDGENKVARVAVSALASSGDGDLIAAMQMTAPLGTYLPTGIGISIDSGSVRTLPFFVCNQTGCVTQANLTAEEVDLFKKGGFATILLRAAVAPDQVVQATLSLTGFTAAFDSLSAR
jgi:invasion protein IalB